MRVGARLAHGGTVLEAGTELDLTDDVAAEAVVRSLVEPVEPVPAPVVVRPVAAAPVRRPADPVTVKYADTNPQKE